MGVAFPSRAEIFSALAQDLDIAKVCRRFGLTREELAQLFGEAAAHFQQKEDAEAGRLSGDRTPSPRHPAPSTPKEGIWRLFVDGAARGNPGPAGAGAVLFDPTGEKQGENHRYLGETTNNVAEYQAFILGLELALSLGVKNLHVSGDSLLVVQQLRGAYRVKTSHLLPLWNQAQKTLQKFDAYVISHVDRSLNHEADDLANQAIDQHQRKR
jgi:ribonuclease HI